jgi:hypothetical protein
MPINRCHTKAPLRYRWLWQGVRLATPQRSKKAVVRSIALRACAKPKNYRARGVNFLHLEPSGKPVRTQ